MDILAHVPITHSQWLARRMRRFEGLPLAMRIVVVDGDPDRSIDRFCHALDAAYVEGARLAGHETGTITIAELDFRLGALLHRGIGHAWSD